MKGSILSILAFILTFALFTGWLAVGCGDNDDATPAGPLEIIFEFPPLAEVGEDYSFAFRATGGTPPYGGWEVVEGEIPAGMTLDSDRGLLFGAAPDEEKLYYFVVEVHDSDMESNYASEAFGVRVGDPALLGKLHQRALAYQEAYLARHNMDGLTVGCDDYDNPDGLYKYSVLGDACFIHGNASAGAAFRYAVEGTEEALENVRLHVRGLDLLNRINDIPGLLSRSYVPPGADINPRYYDVFWPESDNHVVEGGEFDGYYWKGDVSIDQYSGALVGLSIIYDLVDDPDVRATVRRNIVEIADYIWQGGMLIYDADGEPTKYGDFRGWFLEGWPIPDAVGAAGSLAWFKLAFHVSGEQRFNDHYYELLNERHYDVPISSFMWPYFGYMTKHYVIYMAFENMYILTRLEDDPAVKKIYIDAFSRWLWESSGEQLRGRRAKVEANPTFTPWYLFSTGQKDSSAIMKSIWQMDVFMDPPLKYRYIENSANPEIEINPESPTDALYPLPSNLRLPDMCIWHRSPYILDGGANSDAETSGHDYLLPYWMGRYYGYIGADW